MKTNLEILDRSEKKAVSFLKTCVRNGLAHSFDTVSNKWIKPYPEVSGYLLSFFCKTVEDNIVASKIGKCLLRLQRECGGWRSFYGKEVFVFDTAQIGQGLLNWYIICEKKQILDACIRASEFIINMQNPDGSFFPLYSEKNREKISLGETWGNSFSPINVKCVEFLNQMTIMGFADYSNQIYSACKWTLEQPQIEYSHPGAYSLEGLISVGHIEDVTQRIERYFKPFIEKNGFLPYKLGLSYAYVSGSIQIGIICCNLGLIDEAIRIYEWARKVQSSHYSGGLYQYANRDGSINNEIHGEINSWGTKYYVELIQLLKNEKYGFMVSTES